MKSSDGKDSRDERLSDPAFERLRAADPAAAATPDLERLRATVDAAVERDALTAGGAVPALVERTPARVRPSARWFQLAAVSAGVLAVGLGGYALGGRDTAPAPVIAAPVTQDGASGQGSRPADGRGGATDGASLADAKMYAPGWGGRTTFDSAGLDDVPATAHAWAYDPAAAFSEATLARLASVLGVSGAPELSYGTWRAGSTDWTAPSVELSSDSQSSFYFSNPALDPWSEEGAVADAPTAETATALLTDLMATLGVESAAFEIESPDDVQSPGSRSVSAYQLVEGHRTNVRWDLVATTQGIFSVSGQLAPIVDLGEYGVVGAKTAVARLSDPRFGATGGDIIAYARGTEPLDLTLTDPSGEAGVGISDPEDPAAIPDLPGTPQPGGTFAWPVTAVTVTAATLTTSVYYQTDGSAVLLPSYTFTDDSGAQWSTLALADAGLDFSPQD